MSAEKLRPIDWKNVHKSPEYKLAEILANKVNEWTSRGVTQIHATDLFYTIHENTRAAVTERDQLIEALKDAAEGLINARFVINSFAPMTDEVNAEYRKICNQLDRAQQTLAKIEKEEK